MQSKHAEDSRDTIIAEIRMSKSHQLHCNCTVKCSVGWVLVVLHFHDKPLVK